MPMQSQAQRAYLHIHHPEIAEEFEKHTPKGKKLPKHISKKAGMSMFEKIANKLYAEEKSGAYIAGAMYAMKLAGIVTPVAAGIFGPLGAAPAGALTSPPGQRMQGALGASGGAVLGGLTGALGGGILGGLTSPMLGDYASYGAPVGSLLGAIAGSAYGANAGQNITTHNVE